MNYARRVKIVGDKLHLSSGCRPDHRDLYHVFFNFRGIFVYTKIPLKLKKKHDTGPCAPD